MSGMGQSWITRALNRYDKISLPILERMERWSNRDQFRIEILYHKPPAVLARLCDRYGCDKGQVDPQTHRHPWPAHTYTDFYETLFAHNRNGVGLVVECGIGTNTPSPELAAAVAPFADPDRTAVVWDQPGAGLRVWRDYFPNADIIGVDIDKEVLFTDHRIRTFYCDQTSPASIQDFLAAAELQPGTVDVLIDDGLHEFAAGKCLFENTFDLLAPDGVYVIEDVLMRDRKAYDRFLLGREDVVFQVVRLHRPGLAVRDNSLIVIRKAQIG